MLSKFKSIMKEFHWFDLSYHDTLSDWKFLAGYTYFLIFASRQEVAEFIELKQEHDSHKALSMMFYRIRQRYINNKQEQERQLHELQSTQITYSREEYKKEQQRWTERGLSEEEMYERRFGSDKQYTIQEDIQEPVLELTQFDDNVYYCIHDKINGYYPVSIYAIDKIDPEVIRFTDLRCLERAINTILQNTSAEVERRKRWYAKHDEIYNYQQQFYNKYKHAIKDYYKWTEAKEIYDTMHKSKQQESNYEKKKKVLKQVDAVREAIQGQNSSLFDDNLF